MTIAVSPLLRVLAKPVLSLSLLVVPAVLPTFARAQDVSFDRDIRPIMSDTCFRCHGPDASSRMANMRLDLREEAVKPHRNGTPIVPGNTEQSEIIQRIFAKNARVMPPPFAHKELTDKQKDTIRRWVEQGAKYEPHWSYVPVVRPAVPAIPGAAGEAARNPIDAFIEARLAQEKLTPSSEADRRILIRRVTLDLTGLLPTPEQVSAFVQDPSPQAYEHLVDRLLASPAYAEKQSVRWLDAVRYADSAGYHSDGTRPAWPYRDYVLRAFRDNKPFDVFTREQLAGDLLPNATVEEKVATAYNRMGRTSAEGGLQPKEYLAKYGAERVRALSTNWLGSTMGCAECHNHKFDPILTKDFYSMKAFFADVKEKGMIMDTGADAFAPKMAVYNPGQKEKIDAATVQIDEAKKQLDSQADMLSGERRAWEANLTKSAAAGQLKWQFQTPIAVAAQKAHLTVQRVDESAKEADAHPNVTNTGGDGLVVVDGPNPDNETYQVTVKPGAGVWTSVALEVDTNASLAGANISRGSDRFVISEITAAVSQRPNQPRTVAPFSLSYSTVPSSFGFPAQAAIDGDSETGWGVIGETKTPFLILRFATPVRTAKNSTLLLAIHQDSKYRQATIGRFRVALSQGNYPWASNTETRKMPDHSEKEVAPTFEPGLPRQLLRALNRPEGERSPEQVAMVRDYFEYSCPQLFPARLQLTKMEMRKSFLDATVPEVMVTETVAPRETRILARGNWMDDTGAVVTPAIPEFLGKVGSSTPNGPPTRLDLANWLVSAQNPLTPRVYANRVWAQFFGMGLSKTVEDLGSQGEWPVNLELLNWLAAEFMHPAYDAGGTHDWDMRHLVRIIVLSRTYRQSSVSTPELDEHDPDNRFLARQSRFRVDAESVHDIMLQVSGLLVQKFGGPSVEPYQPDQYLAALNFPKRSWSASRSDDLYRRGVYIFWQRTFLHPTLMNFDAPTREECAVFRNPSNTPLQALDLLNDPTFVEAARVFGQRMLSQGGKTVKDRISWGFRQATGRGPENDELQVLSNLYASSLAHFQTNQAETVEYLHIGDATVPPGVPPAELAAMSNVGRVIMNLHEVITRD